MSDGVKGWLQSSGRLRHDPKMKGQKVVEPFWLILDCEDDLRGLYAWLLFRQHCVKLRRPAWGTHISVVRGENVPCPGGWGKNDGKRLSFWYKPLVKTNGRHYWMPISCPALSQVREGYGLPKYPSPNFHLTLGNDELSEPKGAAE